MNGITKEMKDIARKEVEKRRKEEINILKKKPSKGKINNNTNPKYQKYKEITHTIKVLLS